MSNTLPVEFIGHLFGKKPVYKRRTVNNLHSDQFVCYNVDYLKQVRYCLHLTTVLTMDLS